MNNILIFEDSSKSIFGGGQKVTMEVINCLSNNYNIFLFDGSISKSRFILKAKRKVLGTVRLIHVGNIVNKNIFSFSMGVSEIVLTPLLTIINFFIVISYIKKLRLNKINTVMYVTTKKGLLLAFLVNILMKIKYIYHAHNYDHKNSFFYRIIEIPLRNAYKIICVSNIVKKNINQQNCLTLYNPVDLPNDKSPKNINGEEEVVVATFSSLIPLKGIDYFMRSFSFLRNKKKVKYEIYGLGCEYKKLKRLENERIKLFGFTSNVYSLLKDKVDIIVFPSISEEACPMILIEAFAFGIPIIATNIGGQAEIIRDKKVGLLVPIKNAKEIAKKIDYLIENPSFYRKYSLNALTYSENFSLMNFKIKIFDLFDSSFY